MAFSRLLVYYTQNKFKISGDKKIGGGLLRLLVGLNCLAQATFQVS